MSIYFYSHAQKLPKFEINTMPLSFAQISQPHFRIGAKIYITPKIALGTDLGYGLNFFDYQLYIDSYEFKSVRGDLLYSIIRTSEHNLYLGFEYSYQTLYETRSDGSYWGQDGRMLYSQADYMKLKEVFQLKIGLSVYMGKHFFCDVYSGLGYRRKYVEYSNVIDGHFTTSYFDFPDLGSAGFVDGVNWSLGLKLGFAF